MVRKLYCCLFVLFCIGCKAQYNVLPMNVMDNNMNPINSNLPNYYKDLTNELDYYVGTWKYQNGNTSLTIVLQKVTQIPEGDGDVTDDLIGEYRYVENGVELVNSFYRLNNPAYNTAQHRISGATFIPQFLFPKCTDCTTQKTRVKLILTDPGRHWVLASIVLQHIIENGQEKLKAFILSDGIGILPSPSSPTNMRISEQQYILIKQP